MSERKPPGYWTPETIREESRKFMQEHDLIDLPGTDRLRNEYGRRDLVYAISEYYPSGFHGLRKYLGGKNIKTPNGRWNKDTILKEVDNFMRENNSDVLPNLSTLKRVYKRFDLAHAIYRHYPGKFSGLKKDLNQPYSSNKHYSFRSRSHKKSRDVNNKDKIFSDVKSFLEENNLIELPTYTELLENYERKDLVHIVSSYYPGGFPAIRKDLGSKVLRVYRGSWTKELVFAKVKEFMKENNFEVLPSISKLKSVHGRSDLGYAISKYYPGKFPGIRKDLGEKVLKAPDHFWTKDIILSMAEEIMDAKKLRILPGYELLTKYGFSSLSRAIYSHYPGRITALRADLNNLNGIKSDKQKLEDLLNGLSGE